MNDAWDTADLDARIGWTRAGLLAAASASDQQVELAAGLTQLFAERYARRAQAGDATGAKDDLVEMARLLDDVAAEIGAGDPRCTDLVLGAVFADKERWRAFGDNAACAAAVGRLDRLLTWLPESDLVWVDVHAELAMLRGARAEDAMPGDAELAELNAAIGHARLALDGLKRRGADDAVDPAEATGLRALLGFLLADRFRAVRRASDDVAAAATMADRQEAIEQFSDVLGMLDANDPDRPDVVAQLGLMRYNRYVDAEPEGRERDFVDLDTAIGLLTQSVPAAHPAASEHPAASARPAVPELSAGSNPAIADEPDLGVLWGLVGALGDRIELRSDAADRNALIDWGQRLLSHSQISADDMADVRDLLGDALLDRAETGSATRQDDLEAAIGHWQAVLAAIPNDADQVRLLVLLSHACWLRMDGDTSDYDGVDRMVGYAVRAWRGLPTGDKARSAIGLYLVLGAQEQFQRRGHPIDVDLADTVIEVLTEIEPVFADDPELHLLAVVEFGHFLVGRGQIRGDMRDLVAAQPWLSQAAAELRADDPQFAELTMTVAGDMFVLAGLGLAVDHVEDAIGMLNASLRNPSARPDGLAMVRSALGVLYLQLAGLSQSSDHLAAGIAHLTAAFEITPPSDPYRLAIASNLVPAFLIRFLRTGDLQDRDAGRYFFDMMGEADRSSGDAIGDLMADVDVTRLATRGMLRLTDGMVGDQEAFDDAVQDLRSALALLPAGHLYEGRIRGDLGLVLAMRASQLSGAAASAADFEAAMVEVDAALELMPPGHMMRPFMLMRAGGARAGAAIDAGDPERLRAAIDYITNALAEIDPAFGGRVRLVAVLGMAWAELHRLTGQPAHLSAAARWLAEAADELAGQPFHPEYARCLTSLAIVQRARGYAAGAREDGLAALRGRGREVLLQTGTSRALHVARIAASEAATVAGWCLKDRRPEQAVEALELGRGLILHAATSVADVPELLTRAGCSDLAKEWRAQVGSGYEAPWDAGPPGAEQARRLLEGTAALELPNDLRARVLAALAGLAMEQLLAPPTCAQLSAALAATGADALAYLLAPAGDEAGCAIVVPSAVLAAVTAPQVLPLPLLHQSRFGPVDDLAAARRLADESWAEALRAACAWAWPAVIRPLLDLAGQWGLDRPPRLVLIPVGQLSLVPWHAAFGRADGSTAVTYACAEAVISYAASARQLIEISRRDALDLHLSPVIVGNPTFDLAYAGAEAQAIRDRCYPAGRYLGFASLVAGRPADGDGQPDEVLDQLPAASRSGASMIHLACHSVAIGSAPGTSFLLLAGRQELTLDRVLRQASGRPAGAEGGLVSLAACGSDFAADEYDEGLTLATAFLAAGAVTVVGTRWEVPEGQTALLMFMFHHFLTVTGQSPRDALRMAQLWMLDPRRAAPPEMPAHLARDARRTDLTELVAWAAHTHQGR